MNEPTSDVPARDGEQAHGYPADARMTRAVTAVAGGQERPDHAGDPTGGDPTGGDPTGGDPTGGDPTGEWDGDGEDEFFADQPDRSLGRTGRMLLAGIVVALAFSGGVLVQKHHDRGLTAGRGAGTASGNPASGRFPGGAFPGAAEGQSGGAAAIPGGASGAGAAAGATGSAAPAVVGQVVAVKGRTITVKNFAGRIVTVTVPKGTQVTVASTVEVSKLTAGTSVSVTGSTAADGSVTASSVTARP
jgi:hypothetical protein